MRANEEFEVYCPSDGDLVTITEGVSAPGWFVVLHEANDQDDPHVFGVFIATEVTTT